MADKVETPESGGGEGAAVITQVPVQPAAEAKPGAAVEPPNAEAPAVKAEAPKEVTPVTPKENPDAPKEVEPEASKEAKPVIPNEKNQEEPEEVKSEQSAAQPEQSKELKLDEPKKEKQDGQASENKVEAPPAEQTTPEVKAEANGMDDNNTTLKDQSDWQQRESDLLKKIEELEKVKKERTQDRLHLELKVREEEIDLLKARVKNLETELQAALSKPSGKNHEMIEKIKQQHEELLSKARGMIFDKTKVVKNQELQIEALTTQIQSLKDINQITKDLLEIRNSEIKAMEDRLQAMEARFKAEKDRYGLVLQRAQTSSNINDDLRKEYETQLALFKELREKYDLRVKALVAENERLKGTVNPANGPDAGPSS